MNSRDEKELSPQPLRTAAELIGIDSGALLYWARRKMLPAGAVVRTGPGGTGHRRYRVAVIRDWIRKQEIEA